MQRVRLGSAGIMRLSVMTEIAINIMAPAVAAGLPSADSPMLNSFNYTCFVTSVMWAFGAWVQNGGASGSAGSSGLAASGGSQNGGGAGVSASHQGRGAAGSGPAEAGGLQNGVSASKQCSGSDGSKQGEPGQPKAKRPKLQAAAAEGTAAAAPGSDAGLAAGSNGSGAGMGAGAGAGGAAGGAARLAAARQLELMENDAQRQLQQQRSAKLAGDCRLVYGHDATPMNDPSASTGAGRAGSLRQVYRGIGLAEPFAGGKWSNTWLTPRPAALAAPAAVPAAAPAAAAPAPAAAAGKAAKATKAARGAAAAPAAASPAPASAATVAAAAVGMAAACLKGVHAYVTDGGKSAACSLAAAAAVAAAMARQRVDFTAALLSDDAIGASASASPADTIAVPIGVLVPVGIFRLVVRGAVVFMRVYRFIAVARVRASVTHPRSLFAPDFCDFCDLRASRRQRVSAFVSRPQHAAQLHHMAPEAASARRPPPFCSLLMHFNRRSPQHGAHLHYVAPRRHGHGGAQRTPSV